jgi:hypothetical protein
MINVEYSSTLQKIVLYLQEKVAWPGRLSEKVNNVTKTPSLNLNPFQRVLSNFSRSEALYRIFKVICPANNVIGASQGDQLDESQQYRQDYVIQI